MLVKNHITVAGWFTCASVTTRKIINQQYQYMQGDCINRKLTIRFPPEETKALHSPIFIDIWQRIGSRNTEYKDCHFKSDSARSSSMHSLRKAINHSLKRIILKSSYLCSSWPSLVSKNPKSSLTFSLHAAGISAR